MAEEVDLIFRADSSDITKANQNLVKLNKTGTKTEQIVNKTTSQFRVMKGATQQLGFQIQDIAVSLAGGQNAMVVFGQQGSQIASIFGPGGAVIGALLAVGAAIGTALLPNLFKSKKATDELTEAIKALNDIVEETDDKVNVLNKSFKELIDRNTTLSRATIQEALLKTADAIESANKEAKKLAESLSPNELGGRFDRTSLILGALRQQFLDGRIDLKKFNDEVNELFLETKDPSKDFRAVREEITKIADQARIATERRKILLGGVGGLQTEEEIREAEKTKKIADALDKRQQMLAQRQADEDAKILARERAQSARELEGVRRSLLTETQVIEEAYKNRIQIVRDAVYTIGLEKEKANQLEIQLEQKKQEELTRIQDSERQRRRNEIQAITGEFSSLFGNLTALMSSESEKAFKIGQKAAIADATIKGILATINAYESGSKIHPAVGAIFAAAAAATTGAMIAQIKSAQPPGRALGGQVRPGESYRVGEYGPETITMGSNGGVVSPAANDAGIVNLEVVNNVRVVGGDANVKTNTRRVDDRKFVTDIVVDLMSNQSSPARNALHSTSNVQPRGRI